MPTKLCVLLDDAKELAAWTALWNLGRLQTLFYLLCVLNIGPKSKHPIKDTYST